MKKIFPFLFLALMAAVSTFAQTPQTIPYQAVARDATGNLLVNQNVCVQFRIYNQLSGGTLLYEEHHTVTTNKLGLFTVSIGTGGTYDGGSSSNLSGITWGSTGAFMEVALDLTGTCGSYTTMGRSQMVSVPYALFAASAASVAGPAGGDLSGTYPSPQVKGLENNALPALSAGALTWNGAVWTFNNTSYITGNQNITLSGDVSGSGTTNIGTALATVNSNIGTFGSATSVPVITVNGKGLVTGVSSATITGTLPTGTTGQTLYNSSGSWLATSNLYNNGTNVGIGVSTNLVQSLTVFGAIQIGNTSNGVAGSVRWNTTTSDFEGFDGQNWMSLSGLIDRTLIYTED